MFSKNPSDHPVSKQNCSTQLSIFSISEISMVVARVARWLFFKPKNPYLGKFLSALDWKMLIYFTNNWNILRTFGICYDHLVHYVCIWYFFPGFGIM
jgi:hypothetical protein